MAKTRQKHIGRWMLIGAALLWGLAGVCVKSITWGPMAIVAVRSIISLIILLAVKRSLRVKVTRQNLLGAFFMSATSILYISAIKMTTAGTAIVLQYIAPILVFLFAVLFRGRKPRAAEIVLTLSVFAGCVLSFLDSLDFTMLLGNALALLSGFTFAGQLLVMNGQDNEPVDAMILSNFLCFLISVPFLFTEPLDWSAKNIFWLLVLSVFQYGLANLLFSRSIQHVDPVEASLVLTIEPVFNPIPVALFCGEQMSLLAIVGAVMVVAAVTLHGMLPPAESG